MLDDKTVEAFIKVMGMRLHKWRKNPTLEEAQELRKVFSIVEKVDACMLVLPGGPSLGLMDAIDNEAWCYRAAEKAAAN